MTAKTKGFRINRLWNVVLEFTLHSIITFGQGASLPRVSASAREASVLCSLRSVPPEVQHRIQKEFGSWKIQNPSDLNPNAHKRWASEKPLQCPGAVVGRFSTTKDLSYAFLLVAQENGAARYKFVVFNPVTGQSTYEMNIIDQSNYGASDSFIRATRIDKFFDEASRKRFQAQATEGILFVDSAENEYEAEVYFWTNSRYQHEPVDY